MDTNQTALIISLLEQSKQHSVELVPIVIQIVISIATILGVLATYLKAHLAVQNSEDNKKNAMQATSQMVRVQETVNDGHTQLVAKVQKLEEQILSMAKPPAPVVVVETKTEGKQ